MMAANDNMSHSDIDAENKNIRRLKDVLIEEKQERQDKFDELYEKIRDDVGGEFAYHIENIVWPLKRRIDAYFNEVVERGLDERIDEFLHDGEEDLLALKPDEVKEKLKDIMLSYLDDLKDLEEIEEKINF